MAHDDFVDGILDYEYTPTGDQHAPEQTSLPEQASLVEQSLEAARKSLFAPLTIVENGQRRTSTTFAALLDALNRNATSGDPSASKMLDDLERHHEKQREIARSRSDYANSPVRALEKKQERIASLANSVGTMIVLRMLPCFIKAFEEVHGPITSLSSLLPYYLDTDSTIKALDLAHRRWRKTQPRTDYKIGRGKPPVASRFTTERNPRSTAKSVSAWEDYERSRNKPVVITSANGRRVMSNRRDVTYAQLFRAAVRGNPRARREALQIIIRLDRKGLLSPPERPRRSKRKPVELNPRFRMLVRVAEVTMAPSIKRDMLTAFTRRYGPVPAFTTEYERHLPAHEQVEGWAEYQSERAAQQRGADERPSNDAKADIASLPPTRPRTRAALPAHSKHPTLPRAKVPVVKASAPRTPVAHTPGSKRRV